MKPKAIAYAWVCRRGYECVKPIYSARRIHRGKKRGFLEVTFRSASQTFSKAKIDIASIRQWIDRPQELGHDQIEMFHVKQTGQNMICLKKGGLNHE